MSGPASPGALDAGGSVPLAVAVRSGFPESQHVGAAVVLAPDGSVAERHGEVDALVYPRSALKPFQTVAALRAGVRLRPEQQVIVTASHTGTERHLAVVRSVLADAALTEDALKTPPAWPASADAARVRVEQGQGPARIAMNCSGNHAGMLAAARASGWPIDDYLAPDHPVHALSRSVLAEFSGAEPSFPGTDGCGGPVWAVPLTALARGYQRLFAEERGLAVAIREHPELIEGEGTPTTRAVAALGIVAKSGAEGVWAAVASDGSSVAVKVLDGSGRAAAAIAVALLAGRGAVDPALAAAYLDDPALAVLGGGRPVGRIRVSVG